MCYAKLNVIIAAIAGEHADVITIETLRLNRELLEAFENFNHPNDIGPSMYDINWMKALIHKATHKISVKGLWINSGCGLKLRGWEEASRAR